MNRGFRRRSSRRSYGSYSAGHQRAAQHIAQRHELSRTFGGIDRDVERIFLSLDIVHLECVLLRYGREHGSSALSYARDAYHKWQSGRVKMSGLVAERLLNLLPPVLDASTRFDLVKKLRAAHMHRVSTHIQCEPTDWRSRVAPAVAELLAASRTFQLPQTAVNRVRWLTEGDATAAQQLLAAAEQEEAVVRLCYLEAEFKRIDFFVQTIETTRSVTHTIDLPQGTIRVSIALPRKGFWNWLNNILK